MSQKRDDKPVITPKWPTRVFAMECIRMILDVCKNHNKHTDLALARKCKEENSSGMIPAYRKQKVFMLCLNILSQFFLIFEFLKIETFPFQLNFL